MHISRSGFAFSKMKEEYLSEDLADHCSCALTGHLHSYFWIVLGHNKISQSLFPWFPSIPSSFIPGSTWGHPEAFIGHDEGHMLSCTNPFQLLAFASLAYPQGNSVTALELPAELSYACDGAGCIIFSFLWKGAYFHLLDLQENVKQKVYSNIHSIVFLVFPLMSQWKAEYFVYLV